MICKEEVEKRKGSSYPQSVFAGCGLPAKYKLTYNRNYLRSDKPVEEISKYVCKRHLNAYMGNFNRMKAIDEAQGDINKLYARLKVEQMYNVKIR